jgi:CarD family transcriptional regulator
VVFEIGDKVVYPNHGIGIVEEIATRSTSEGAVRGYQLRILANDSRVFVPQESASGVGLRPMVKAADVRKVLSMLGDGQIEHQTNWKGRFKDNSDRMRTGSLYDAASVLKGLTFLAKKKSLSFREKRMLERARFLVVSEIAEVEGKPSDNVEERVDRALSRTFAQEETGPGGAGAGRGSAV